MSMDDLSVYYQNPSPGSFEQARAFLHPERLRELRSLDFKTWAETTNTYDKPVSEAEVAA